MIEQEDPAIEKEKERLHKLIVLVGDQGSDCYKRDLNKLNEVLLTQLNKSMQNSWSRAFILKKLAISIRALTAKGRVYACTAYLLGATQKAFVESLIEAVYAQFIEDLQNSNFYGVKNAFLFFAECTNLEILHIFTFLSLLNILIRQAERATKVAKEELAFIVLSTVPFMADYPLDLCEMEFKNAVDEVDKLYRSCSFSYFHNVLLLTKPAPNMLETAYNYFKQAIAGKKAVEVINQGYKELITESKSTKSIRKTFDYSPVESKINWGTVVHRRILNFVFLNLFKEQYEEHGVAPIDLHMAAMFFYEIILSHKLNIMILNEILPKYNFKNTEKVKNYILLELILTETLKTFQPSGHLVYLACIASQLEDEIRTQEAGKLSIQVALEKLAVHINDISTCGLENLASWFAHVKANKPALTLAWLKDQKGTEKGKFLIGMVLRDIMQLSSYSKLNEFNGLAEFIEQFPENPQPVCELVNAGHIRHADYQILLDKLTQEISGEEMSQVLNSNDLSCCGSELQDVFLQTLLQKSSTSLNELCVMLDRYEGVLRDFFKKGEQHQLECLKTIERTWVNSHFHIVVIFEKVVRRELIHIKTMAGYLIEKLTNRAISLYRSSVYYKALKNCLKVASINRKKLEADSSEKLLPILKRHKSEFFEVFVLIVDQLNAALGAMEDPFQREMVGVRIYDLVIDFWEESCEALDRILQKVHLPSVAGRLAQLSSMMSTN